MEIYKQKLIIYNHLNLILLPLKISSAVALKNNNRLLHPEELAIDKVASSLETTKYTES